MSGPKLTPQQQAVVDDRGGTLLVSAAAGSGKTKVLVDRLLDRVSREGEDIDRFLVITYTKAAAAELRGKVAAELNRRLALHPEDRHLRRQTTLIYHAQISTIHSFCAALLREGGYTLDLDPDFRVAEESECDILRLRALNRVLEERYETMTEKGDFACLVDTFAAGRDDSRLVDMVLDVHSHVQSHPDPVAWLAEQERAFSLAGVDQAGDTPWGRLLMEDGAAFVAYWQGKMQECLAALENAPDLLAAYGPSLGETAAGLDRFARALTGTWDEAAAQAEVPFPRLKSVRGAEDPFLQARVKAIREGCKKEMAALAERFSQSNALLLEGMREVYPAVAELFRLTADYDRAYGAEKRRRNVLDFPDLEHFALRALTGADGGPTPLARQWSGRFAEVMVDEYQDTNRVQNAIFQAVSREGQNLFFVGDVKQSIYRFRLADPTIFLDKYARFVPGAEAKPGESRKLVLSKNFRSCPAVLDGVNFLFRALMSPEVGELAYTPEQWLYPGLAPREGAEDQVELDVVDMADVPGGGDEEKTAKALVEARFVARRIRQLLDGGFQVAGENGPRRVEPEDIAILHRSPSSVLGVLTRALEEEGILWQADGGDVFFSAPEIAVATGLLQVADNPRQDVPLIAVLRSPVFAFSGDRLAAIRSGCREGDFYTALLAARDRGEGDAAAFLAELDALRSQAVDQGCAAFLWQMYEQTDILAIYGGMPDGEKRQSRLRLLYDMACRFEKGGARGLFSFVAYLRRMEENGDAPGGTESAGAGVRIMSIHKSKGLEFPVVVLCGLAKRFNRADQTKPMLYHPVLGVGPKGLDRDRMIEYPTLARTAVTLQLDREMRSEELRLLYVAMTRAKEKLIMTCALADLAKTVEKLAPICASPVPPQALAGLGSLAEWMLLPVLPRPDAGALRGDCWFPEGAGDWGMPWVIRRIPGEDYAAAPQARRTGAAASRAAAPLPVAGAELARRLAWQYPYSGAVDFPSKLTATQLKGRQLDKEAAEEAPVPPRPAAECFARPDFAQAERGLTPAQRGSAQHLVMQLIDPARAATAAGVTEEIARLTAGQYLTEAQAQAVRPEEVAAFFASPLGREAAGAADLRREFKFSLLVPAGQWAPDLGPGEEVLFQGVIDCCFSGAEGFTVVDFKTDRVAPGGEKARAEEYRTQLDVYTRALEQITGGAVARRVVWFFTTGTGVEL